MFRLKYRKPSAGEIKVPNKVISYCIKYQPNALCEIYYHFVSHYPDTFRRFNLHPRGGGGGPTQVYSLSGTQRVIVYLK
jgi:hypothetical protein